MPVLNDDAWDLIVERIRIGECVPFLGAAASLASDGHAGLPSAGQLAELLADKCHYPSPDRTDLLRVAQYYEIVKDPPSLRQAVRELLLVKDVEPTAVHRVLADLPFRFIFTTNYDDLMERALRQVPKTPSVAVYAQRADQVEVPDPTIEQPLVYKLHGTLEQADSILITEDDVVEFLACLLNGDPPLPGVIKRCFAECSLLFIGYGLRDWNVRVMLRAFRGAKRLHAGKVSFAIQRRPGEPDEARQWDQFVGFWDKENLRCYDMDAAVFADMLRKKYHQGDAGADRR